ncbi:hypothetical protein O7A05_30365 [Mesorhizobium sp. Cs1330R2N1]|uniref:LysR substrate-binding domain-containing protein n=1 Tax=Mesorhizobium argentiipisi TaxID=3015175 RepID=A0ABU8KM43_9HYPH
MGLGIVPKSLARLAPSNVVFRDLEDAPIMKHVAIWRQDCTNPAVASFIETLRHASAEGEG